MSLAKRCLAKVEGFRKFAKRVMVGAGVRQVADNAHLIVKVL